MTASTRSTPSWYRSIGATRCMFRALIDQAISLSVDWLPSTEVIARSARVSIRRTKARNDNWRFPAIEQNLVHRALSRFIETFDVSGGFHCRLGKSIPAGAGMGGASSDAASALQCCCRPLRISRKTPASFAKSRPRSAATYRFFSGSTDEKIAAGRARGRGELLSAVSLKSTLYFVIIFSGVNLSTGKVYANSQVSRTPQDADRFICRS